MTSDDFDSSDSGSSSHSPKDYRGPKTDFQRQEAKVNQTFRLPAWAKGALIIAVIGLASVGYFSDFFQHSRPSTAQAGPPQTATAIDPDPEEIAKRTVVSDFILTDADKKLKKLSDFRGNVVILTFWASWCAPCLVELPTFAEIENQYHERGLRVLAINVDEGDEGKVFAKDFWAKEKFTFPTFFDSDKKLQSQFGVDILPSNFVIDRAGRIAFSGFGANDWSNPQTKDFIDGLLQEEVSQKEVSPGAKAN